jgi:hypothetical protein
MLLVIDVVKSQDRLLLQTVWSSEPDQLGGVGRTDIETVASLDHLVHRLNELAALIFGLDRLAAAA